METRIKERLVGAIALVAIVVIVVPELLTGPRTPAPSPPPPAVNPVHTVTIDLASGERGAIARTPAPGAAPAAPPPAAAAPTAEVRPAAPPGGPDAVPAPGGASGTPATASPEPHPPATQATAPAPSAPSAPSPPAARPPEASRVPPPPASGDAPPAPKPAVPASGAEGWVVQLGSFASRDNAEGLAKGLRAKGYRAFVSEFRGSGRVLYRVRVGPEQDRARADAIAARLARDGHKGSVAPQP